jgi:1-acyl-sn-glycerol-3-phosphate acyltransferase
MSQLPDDDNGPESLSPDVVDGDPSRRASTFDDADEHDDEPEVEAPRSRAPLSEAEVAAKIRSLEERLDEMIGDSRGASTSFTAFSPPPSLPSGRTLPPEPEATVFDTARELLTREFYLRKWGRLGMRNRSEEVDDFGFDPVYEKKVSPIFDFLYERYFRVECEGIAKIPAEGRCLLVANHSGTLPYDGLMIKTAVKREHPQHRDVRWLAEDFLFHFPFLGSITNRIGAVRACQENAERLLEQESLTAVFPEGVKGIGKLFRKRYQLQRFGRGGFIKLSLRTRSPIIPVAVIGAEETNPMLFRIDYLSRVLGIPYIPVTPTFPLLGPAGLLPLPTKWKIIFGDPMSLDAYGPEAADDEMLVGRLAEEVRASIQAMLDAAIKKRESVWLG